MTEARAVTAFIHATSMVSALGLGRAAHVAALHEGRTGLRGNDFPPALGLATMIGRVDAVEAAECPPAVRALDCRNHRLAELALAHDGVEAAIAGAVRRHGASRVGVVVGSSTSGILSTELYSRELFALVTRTTRPCHADKAPMSGGQPPFVRRKML